MSLHETTNLLLYNPEKTGTWLNLADKYIQSYNEAADMFVLPKAYSFLKPLIESYANNLDGFVQYLLGIRDSFPRGSLAYGEVHTLYRRVNGRYIQQVRRERMARAVAKAEELYGPTEYINRMKWMADLEHSWAKRRLEFMDAAGHGKRMTHDERADHLDEFWCSIDTEIYNGENIPPWD